MTDQKECQPVQRYCAYAAAVKFGIQANVNITSHFLYDLA